MNLNYDLPELLASERDNRLREIKGYGNKLIGEVFEHQKQAKCISLYHHIHQECHQECDKN